MTTIRTDYAGHDRQYRLRRDAGQNGWDDAAGVAATLAELARELDAPHVPRAGRALEIGCGAGDLSLFLAARGYSVTGVDIAPFAVAWAREKAASRGVPETAASFHVGDVCDLAGLPDDAFDLVLDGQCLHCIIGPDRARLLASVRRVLKPAGLLHVRTMCGDPRTPGLRDGFDPATRCQVRGGVAVRYVGLPDDITAEVRAAGFAVVASRILATEGEDMLILDAVKEDRPSGSAPTEAAP